MILVGFVSRARRGCDRHRCHRFSRGMKERGSWTLAGRSTGPRVLHLSHRDDDDLQARLVLVLVLVLPH
jgi:hypothetical protein